MTSLFFSLVLSATIDASQICARHTAGKVPAEAAAAVAKFGETREVEMAERFANGEEVTRNLEIAEYFLCLAEESIAPAEFDGMFEHLQAMKRGEEPGELRFCDHVTSGYGSSFCASLEWDRVMPELDRQLNALRPKTHATKAFDTLRTAGNDFVRAESERIGEQSRGGTGYAAISLGAEMEAKEALVDAIRKWSSGRAPEASERDLQAADKSLNAEYRSLQAFYAEIDDGDTATEWKTYLRDAQRAWIRYRDAFALYYAELWSGRASADALRREIVTQLTRDRAAAMRAEH